MIIFNKRLTTTCLSGKQNRGTLLLHGEWQVAFLYQPQEQDFQQAQYLLHESMRQRHDTLSEPTLLLKERDSRSLDQ